MRRDAWVLVGLWLIGYALSPLRLTKRWYLRLKLRAKMRWLGLVPALAVLWCVTEVSRLAAQGPSDSLITTVLVRHAIGEWRDSVYKAYCITWHAEAPSRPHLLFLLDAVVADTTHAPLCPDPLGGFYPVLLDAPECPDEGRVRVTDRAWIIIRCGDGRFARYRRPPGKAT